MKLVRLLQQSYAIEIGAYNAYEGHWRSLKYPQERAEIQKIQLEEDEHRKALGEMLDQLGAKPNKFMNAILWCIGKTISAACHVMGYRLGMWGASIMEKMGGICYREVAKHATSQGLDEMAEMLRDMQAAEERHELYLKECLKITQ